MAIIPHTCPTCGAKEGEPCRTPSGRLKKTYGKLSIHDTRPFSVTFESEPEKRDDN